MIIWDVLAIICAIVMFIFVMALDSPTVIPLVVCLVCAIYLTIYARAKGVDVDELDRWSCGRLFATWCRTGRKPK